MKKPKIALFIVSMTARGAERVASNILQYLSDEFEFHLLLLNNTIAYELPKGLIIHCLDNENLDNPTGFDKIKSLVKMPFLAYKLKQYLNILSISLVFYIITVKKLNKMGWLVI